MAANRFLDPDFLNGSKKLHSFLDALSGSASDVYFSEIKMTNFRTLPSVWILEEEIISLAAPFQYALVGFFPSRHPSLDSIYKFFFSTLNFIHLSSQ
ncbi:hypothetical protein IEQ34_012730 [Dendrobium chrysotoxum]|uniref:Uncharacterized protein n=1 Tax=Dendrobium chrysotoxum TaxID=161865 RepID=A0AAV7GPJ8_DENCH|nr:hypothetical protein IEQ34_012730 [Dendrobium chrysotoxum]